MLLAMITESYGSCSFAFMLLFMEGPHGFCSVCIDLNRSVINLAHGLKFDVVTPLTVLSFLMDVVLKCGFTPDYELSEEFFFAFYIAHACLSEQVKVALVSVDLVRNRSEHAVTVTFNFNDLQTFKSQHPSKIVLLFFDFLDFLSQNL